jgi:hypothetical protein
MNLDKSSDRHSPFQLINVDLMIALNPSALNNPMLSIKNHLNDLLFRYNDQIDAVPIVYSDVKIPEEQQYAKILAESPWLHVLVTSKFLIFKPYKGLMIRGLVTKV